MTTRVWWWRMQAAAALRALAQRLDPTLAGYRVPITTPAPWAPTCARCGGHVPDQGLLHWHTQVCDACSMDPDMEA